MIKRHLGIDIDEWNRLPWWKQRVYMEGLMEEFGEQQEGSSPQTAPTRVLDLDEDGPDALSQFGVVRQAI